MAGTVAQLSKTELSELALDAAVELDLGSTPVKAQSAVSKFLRVISDQITDHEGSLFLKDETLLPIYSYALAADFQQGYVDRDGLLARLSQVATKQLADEHPQEALRRFFLAVHEALSTDLIDEHVNSVVMNEHIRQRILQFEVQGLPIYN
ncbi:MAG: hypothetical protein ABIK36_08095 [Pseudomonadota bacterium]